MNSSYAICNYFKPEVVNVTSRDSPCHSTDLEQLFVCLELTFVIMSNSCEFFSNF